MSFLDKAKQMVSENKEKIDEGIERAEDEIQKRTDDKMDARVESAGNAAQDALRKMD